MPWTYTQFQKKKKRKKSRNCFQKIKKNANKEFYIAIEKSFIHYLNP